MFADKVQLKANFKDSRIDLGELNVFYPEFGNAKTVIFNSELTGTINALSALNLDLKSNGGTKIKGDFNFKNLKTSEFQPFEMTAKLNQLSSTYKDLKGILPRILGKNLPPSLEFLGTFSATGLLTISEPIISLNCEVDTALGQISTDLSLDIINDINTAIYNGQLELFNFDIGALIQDTNFGLVNTNLNIQGQGFSMESIRSNVVGIFSDFTPEEITRIVETTGLNAAQMHGNESHEDCQLVAKSVPFTIKALPFDSSDLSNFGDYGVDFLLLDSNTPGEGKRFDWNISAESIKSEKLILAGGLNVENLSAGIEKFSPFGVDVATGVESEPRRKDPELLKIFIETAKSFKAKTD